MTKDPSAIDDHPDSQFLESIYEHTDSVVCIEKNFKDKQTFLTGSKDASVYIWKFVEGDDKVKFIYDIQKSNLK